MGQMENPAFTSITMDQFFFKKCQFIPQVPNHPTSDQKIVGAHDVTQKIGTLVNRLWLRQRFQL